MPDSLAYFPLYAITNYITLNDIELIYANRRAPQ